jgi:hypothetical protein
VRTFAPVFASAFAFFSFSFPSAEPPAPRVFFGFAFGFAFGWSGLAFEFELVGVLKGKQMLLEPMAAVYSSWGSVNFISRWSIVEQKHPICSHTRLHVERCVRRAAFRHATPQKASPHIAHSEKHGVLHLSHGRFITDPSGIEKSMPFAMMSFEYRFTNDSLVCVASMSAAPTLDATSPAHPAVLAHASFHSRVVARFSPSVTENAAAFALNADHRWSSRF